MPAPAWLRSLTTYTNWPQEKDAHGPFGKDRLSARERKALRGVPMYVNVQTKNAVREAHALGGRALCYVSFMDTYVHTAGFERGTARAPWDPKRPQVLLIDREGRFVNTPMDGTWRMWRYLVCNNTAEYVEMALDLARKAMGAGADGLFVDNSGHRISCYGHGAPVGYSPRYRQVMAGRPEWPEDVDISLPPEELHRRGVRPSYATNPGFADLPVHRHLYPNKGHVYAYGRLLQRVRRLVRGYGDDKVLVMNGHSHPETADAVMLESYLYTWVRVGPWRTWAQLKETAAEWAPYLRKGKKVMALTYVGRSRRAVEEDALHACAAALYSGFAWSDYGTCPGPIGETLRRLDLGKKLATGADGDVDYAFFERGAVAVNGGSRRRAATLAPPKRFGPQRLIDLAENDEALARNGAFRVTVPANGGRVLVAAE